MCAHLYIYICFVLFCFWSAGAPAWRGSRQALDAISEYIVILCVKSFDFGLHACLTFFWGGNCVLWDYCPSCVCFTHSPTTHHPPSVRTQAALVRRVTFMVWHKEAKHGHGHGDDKDEVSGVSLFIGDS